jgi:hypothetical protein
LRNSTILKNYLNRLPWLELQSIAMSLVVIRLENILGI